MANKKNKVKFGLTNVHYAKIKDWVTDASGANLTPVYVDPVRLPGAVSISIDANGENENFYADDIVYYVISNNSGYEGDLEIALIPTDFSTDILGEILDSKGTKLASSEKVYDLVLDIKQMNNKEDYVEPTIQALEDYFSIDGDQVRAYAQEHPDSQYYVLKKRMSYNEISDYQQMMADTSQKEYNQYVKGIWFEESYKRVYPNSSLASDVIGFTRTDGTGTYGLEE